MLTQPLYLWHRGSHGSRNNMRDFLGDPVSKTARFHCLGYWFGLLVEELSVPHPTQWGQKKKKRIT